MPIKWRFLVFLNYHLIAVSLKADRMTAHDRTIWGPRLHTVDSCAVVLHDRTTIDLRAVVSVRTKLTTT